jgi:ectoine hydroxylase
MDAADSPLKTITAADKARYAEDGYLSLPSFVMGDWLDRLTEATARIVEESRAETQSGPKFDIEPDHTAENPRLRRLVSPQDHDPAYYDFMTGGPIVDLAEDLLGPNLKFHHGKLNFKWADGGAEVKWHQDIPFWPHTNYEVLTIGLALDDSDDAMGPMGVLPGSHRGPIYDHFNAAGDWRGYIGEEDAAGIDLDAADYLKGPKGSVTVHHCRMVHGSKPNTHPTKARPFLLFAYSAADCLPLMPYNSPSKHSGKIVRGRHPAYPKFDPDVCKLPPLRDSSGPYRSIFASQQGEDSEGKAAPSMM